MKGCTDKKIILRFFFPTGLFCVHGKFQVRQSSPSIFLLKNATFFIIFVGKIFVLQNIYGFTPFIKILSCVDQKWPKTKQLKMFLTSNCSIGLHSAMVQYSNIFSISASPPPAPAAPNLKPREENGQKSTKFYIFVYLTNSLPIPAASVSPLSPLSSRCASCSSTCIGFNVRFQGKIW